VAERPDAARDAALIADLYRRLAERGELLSAALAVAHHQHVEIHRRDATIARLRDALRQQRQIRSAA
jgi:hypothetical protein